MARVVDKLEKIFLEKVDRTVKLMKTVEIPPFGTVQVHGITEVNGHDNRDNLIVELKNNGCNPFSSGCT